MEAVSGKKKLRIQKYPDTCGRGLEVLSLSCIVIMQNQLLSYIQVNSVLNWKTKGQRRMLMTKLTQAKKKKTYTNPTRGKYYCTLGQQSTGFIIINTVYLHAVFGSLHRSMAFSASSLSSCFQPALLKKVTSSHQICNSSLKKANTWSSSSTTAGHASAAAAANTAHATTGTTRVSTVNTWYLIIWLEAWIVWVLTGIWVIVLSRENINNGRLRVKVKGFYTGAYALWSLVHLWMKTREERMVIQIRRKKWEWSRHTRPDGWSRSPLVSPAFWPGSFPV